MSAKVPTLEAILETPWALQPRTLSFLVDSLRRGPITVAEPFRALSLSGPHEGPARVGSVAIVPVYGLISHRPDIIGELFGEASIEQLRPVLQSALNDPAVRSIVLDVDSPGGTTSGVTEFASELRALRGNGKPIVAVANTLAASAAYWLASQADEIVMTPSAAVGGIGIYAVHQEASRMLEREGITTTVISAGPHKTEANEWEPLSDEARVALQERADAYYESFIADVAAGRGVEPQDVEERFGGGRVLMGRQALRAGMVDRVETLAKTIGRLQRSNGSMSRRHVAELGAPSMEARAIGSHESATSDDSWDGPANEARLPSPLPVAKARAAYAWIDESRIEDGAVPKDACKFIHHEIAGDGAVGAANMAACSSGRSVLRGGRGGTTVPEADRDGIWNHLAAHERDGGRDVESMTGHLPFADRLTALVDEATDLVDHARIRAQLRAKEARPAFSAESTTALRSIRQAIDELLVPDEPVSSATEAGADEPPQGPETSRQVMSAPLANTSQDEFIAQLEEIHFP